MLARAKPCQRQAPTKVFISSLEDKGTFLEATSKEREKASKSVRMSLHQSSPSRLLRVEGTGWTLAPTSENQAQATRPRNAEARSF